ncbi:MAG TPA: AraC family transcriptional regulator [Casimicrobiaceae bacterium]|nr:AraC family transcriptional regulator [Casimicrobiaceae bacterium]
MEATLIARRPNRCVIPLTVGVGHTSALVSAGLAATLARMPGCQVRQWETTPGACDRNCATPADLIFGDSALLKYCRENSKRSLEICSFDKARFVGVTARDDPLANASMADGEVVERLSVESTEEEVFAIVQRLTDSARGAAWPTASVAAHACAGMTEQSSPSTRVELGVPAHRRIGTSASVRPIRPIVHGGLAPAALRRVREYVEQQFTEKIRSGTLATIAKLSPGHFNRAFKQSMGFSPHQYIVQRRVAAATQLLEKTERSLVDIALETGFASQSHFCRTYVVATGETPGACRRRHR